MSRLQDALELANESGATSDARQVPDPPNRSDMVAGQLPWHFERREPARRQHEDGSDARPHPGAVLTLARPGGAEVAPSVDFSAIDKLIPDGNHPGLIEQYRKLAADLHHAWTERGVRVVMVTSAVSGEGKTLTATKLALTFSESYRRRVLLIDSDLRRPSVHTVFNLPNSVGLGDTLKTDDSSRVPIQQMSANLFVLTAGRPDPDPMAALTSDRMTHLLEDARGAFDWVVLDTPPVAVLPDAHLLTARVDLTLLVIAAAKSPHYLLERAVKAIGRDRIAGVVLNRVDKATATPQSGGYYGYDFSDGD